MEENVKESSIDKEEDTEIVLLIKQILALFSIKKDNLELRYIKIWLNLIKDRIEHIQNESISITEGSASRNMALNEAFCKEKLLDLNELILNIDAKEMKKITTKDDL